MRGGGCLRKDDLGNGYFVYQDPAAFCFGVDAVLLAHFPALRDGDRIMDLCSGFAPIPVLLAAEAGKQKKEVRITGLEIQKAVAETAVKTVRDNGLEKRITIVNGDLREAAAAFGAASFSLVTCNPPYVPAGSGIIGTNRARAVARTELLCTLRDVVETASKLLIPGGRFAMVHRPARLPEIFLAFHECHLEPKRMRLVHPSCGKEPSMVLLEAVKGGKPQMNVEPPLMIRGESGHYTKELLDIYGMTGEDASGPESSH